MKALFVSTILFIGQQLYSQKSNKEKFDSLYRINKSFAITAEKDSTFIINADTANILVKKLQAKSWFLKGDLFSREQCLLSDKTSEKQEQELVFFISYLPGYMKLRNAKKDFTCRYEIIKDMFRFHYSYNNDTYVHYFRITESSDQKKFMLTPINAGDLKTAQGPKGNH